MPNLKTANNTLIIADNDDLYIINRSGSYSLRSKGIGHLHETLKNYFNGQYDETQLIESVPSRYRPMLKSYLTSLRTAGALVTTTVPPKRNPRLEVSTRTGYSEGRRNNIHVTSNFREVADGQYDDVDLFVLFIGMTELSELLVMAEKTWQRSGSSYVVVLEDGDGRTAPKEGGHDIVKLVTEILFERYIELSASDNIFVVYRLDTTRFELKKIMDITNGKSKTPKFKEIPEQLKIVRLSELNQMPLISLLTRKDYFDFCLLRVGLDFRTIKNELLNEFKVRLVLNHSRSMRFNKVNIVSGIESCKRVKLDKVTCLVPVPASTMMVASNFEDLVLGCLERFEFGRHMKESPPVWNKVDILRHENVRKDILYLTRILKLRMKKLPICWCVTQGGLFIFRTDDFCSFSFLRDMAITELLIYQVAKLFYATDLDNANISIGFSHYASAKERKEYLDLKMKFYKTSYSNLFFLFQEIQLWGSRLYIGYFDNDTTTND